jgi:hypothetical protein
MTKKQPDITPTSLNYVLLDVRLTVAVESYFCEEHEGEATEYASEQVIQALQQGDSEIIVLGSDISRLRVQS